MKTRPTAFPFGILLALLLSTLSCSQDQPQLRTVKLMSGGEVVDLSGDWRVDYTYYGIYQALSGYSHVVRIYQDADQFMALVKDQDQFFAMGTQIVRGHLYIDGIQNAQIWTKDRGWLNCDGAIFDNGNRIVLLEPSQKRTFTRLKS